MLISYDGIAYRQSRRLEAPWLVSFVAPAEELLSWAGIPRRSEQNLSGFQRTDDPIRIGKAKSYFEMPDNQSPTALVVGIHPPPHDDSRRVTLELTGGNDGDSIRPCRLTIDYDYDAVDLATAIELVRRQLEYRLGAVEEDDEEEMEAELEGQIANEIDAMGDTIAEPTDLEVDGAEQVAVIGDEEDEDEAAVEDEEIELGRSILRRLLDRLEDPAWCAEQEEAIRDLAKPATVIDGQHRVKGAEACERNIPFAVCAIFDCPWPEQVFQFTVVNYTAKGIPDQFITANAALSLTKGELDELADRLVQADVKVIEYELMKIVQFDDRSPFFELVDLTEKRNPTKIGYRTMVQVAREWYNGRHAVFDLILPNIYPDLHGRGAKSARISRWKNGDWGEFFLDFWRVVHDEYARDPSHEDGFLLWDVGNSQLVNAVVLLELQRAYLKNLNDQDEEFFALSPTDDLVRDMRTKLVRRAEKFIEWFPSSFFATKWGMTSLNTGPGRLVLQQTLPQFVDKKGHYQYARSALVTGKTEK